jgi:hypothetical protein
MKPTPRRPDSQSIKSTPRAKTLTWEHVKQALQRDWAQTRADFSGGGKELHQNVGDTVKQATGRQPIPPKGVPNPTRALSPQDWERAEPAVRYGFNSHAELGTNHTMWSDELDRKLAHGWNERATGMKYDDVREAVKVGWNAATRG